MLETLISSKTRIKLLLKFFLNPESKSYLRGLENEFEESTNAIRIELGRFEEADMLESNKQGNRKYYQANRKHPLFKEIQGIVRKHVGIDQIILKIVNQLGSLEQVYVEGELAQGLNTKIVDLIFVGKHIDRYYLTELIEKAEKIIDKRIRYVVFTAREAKSYIDNQATKPLLIWGKVSAEK